MDRDCGESGRRVGGLDVCRLQIKVIRLMPPTAKLDAKSHAGADSIKHVQRVRRSVTAADRPRSPYLPYQSTPHDAAKHAQRPVEMLALDPCDLHSASLSIIHNPLSHTL